VISELKQSTRVTKIQEIEVEKQNYQNEVFRLRSLLESYNLNFSKAKT
jgi:hypothetical protein